jgi:hypothetical protein
LGQKIDYSVFYLVDQSGIGAADHFSIHFKHNNFTLGNYVCRATSFGNKVSR